MLKVVLSVLLLLPSFVFASVTYSELILENEKGEMLSQVSGLGKLDRWIVVLVQDQNTLYIEEEKKLASAFSSKAERIRLIPVQIKMDELTTVSWEAIEFAKVGGEIYAFFFHEHDFDGDQHQIYFANVKNDGNSFSFSKLKKLGPALPILQNKNFSLDRRENYGYEAIVWDQVNEALLLLPELKSQPKFSLSLSGRLTKLGTAEHELRASDLSNVSKQCAIATSFCYQSKSFSDALCQGNNGSPKLSLATFMKTTAELKLIDTRDFTQELMPVGYDPAYSSAKEKARTFNAEGVVTFQNGFLLANDNKPQGKSRSVLRYIPDLSIDAETCRFQ